MEKLSKFINLKQVEINKKGPSVGVNFSELLDDVTFIDPKKKVEESLRIGSYNKKSEELKQSKSSNKDTSSFDIVDINSNSQSLISPAAP